jgi:hypothetical protein
MPWKRWLSTEHGAVINEGTLARAAERTPPPDDLKRFVDVMKDALDLRLAPTAAPPSNHDWRLIHLRV